MIHKDNILFTVKFSNYARSHYLKRFEKDYKGRQWEVTVDSIIEELKRLKICDNDLQRTQQVDELWHKDYYWIFKYDFKIAKTKISSKTSGNRCIAFLDNSSNEITILIIFGKGDLPKNINEQVFIEKTLTAEFPDYLDLVR